MIDKYNILYFFIISVIKRVDNGMTIKNNVGLVRIVPRC